MKIDHIFSNKAPKPFGTYSHATKANGLMFISGQLPISPETNELISDNSIDQIQQCFENIKTICDDAGVSLQNALKINVYYTDFEVSENLNAVMKKYFNEPYPARIRVKVVGLSKNAKVEIDGVFLCKE